MKAVGIVGYKNSGKTVLTLRLSQKLSSMGYSVGVLKHVPGDIGFPDTDTSKVRAHVPFVAAISSGETEIILKGEKRIEDILAYCNADIVLIEGFKEENTFPKIVCLREPGEEKELFRGLELCTASFNDTIADFYIENDDHISKMATIVSERSFKLPRLNCGHCGYESCFELAKEIVGGRENINRCVSLNPPISIEIAGTMFPLNLFTSDLFKNTILAMLSSLRGFKKGTVRIEIPNE